MSEAEVSHYRVELKNGEVHYIRADFMTSMGMTGDSIMLGIKGQGPVAYFEQVAVASIIPIGKLPGWVVGHGETEGRDV